MIFVNRAYDLVNDLRDNSRVIAICLIGVVVVVGGTLWAGVRNLSLNQRHAAALAPLRQRIESFGDKDDRNENVDKARRNLGLAKQAYARAEEFLCKAEQNLGLQTKPEQPGAPKVGALPSGNQSEESPK